ncbi:MAG: DoxX family protein [Pseudomonadota bacterium]
MNTAAINTHQDSQRGENKRTRFTAPALADLAGRAGLAAIFLLAGLNKFSGYAGTQAYMESAGLSGSLLPAVIALEIIGAALLVVGYKTRYAALSLAGFSLASAVFFHANLADQMQFIMFFKNVGLAGGFLVLAAHGAGALSLDARRSAV